MKYFIIIYFNIIFTLKLYYVKTIFYNDIIGCSRKFTKDFFFLINIKEIIVKDIKAKKN